MGTEQVVQSVLRAAAALALWLVPVEVTAQAVAPPVTTAPVTEPLVGPPVRRIESAQSVSTEPLGAINGVRPLADGRLLLNDGARRRLLLLDSTLKVVGVVLDSLTDVQNAYGTRAGALIPYRGDSTLFIDPATYAMLVIDGAGKIARVRSVPRAQDVSWFSSGSGQYGMPGFDARGRLVYRIPAQAARPLVAPPPGVPYFPTQPDSAFVVGIHLDTRKIDTLGAVRVPKFVMKVQQGTDGGYNVRSINNPLPLVDDWTVMPDGSVAFVRGRDYRVDYLDVDGTVTSSEKLPFPWVRLTEEDKAHFVDSLKTAATRNAGNSFTTETIVWSNLLNKPYPPGFVPVAGYVVPPGFPRDWILPAPLKFPANYVYACAPGTTPPAASVAGAAANGAPPMPPGAGGASGRGDVAPSCVPNDYANYYGNGYTPPAPVYRAPLIVPASELPDYRPPIGSGAVRADEDGNLWIRPIQMKPRPGGTIYDVVNRAGVLVDRIQVPSGYQLAGFGAGKIVYLSQRDATGLHLARVRLR